MLRKVSGVGNSEGAVVEKNSETRRAEILNYSQLAM